MGKILAPHSTDHVDNLDRSEDCRLKTLQNKDHNAMRSSKLKPARIYLFIAGLSIRRKREGKNEKDPGGKRMNQKDKCPRIGRRQLIIFKVLKMK